MDRPAACAAGGAHGEEVVVGPSRFDIGASGRLRAMKPLFTALWLGPFVVAALLATATVEAATWTVDSTGDGPDKNIGNGTCAAAGPAPNCTLRAALQAAKLTAGIDTINFAIARAVPQPIVLGSALPEITRPVSIDATTQPGFAGSPLIEIRGVATANIAGIDLQFGSSGSTIKGLIINNFTGAIGVRI